MVKAKMKNFIAEELARRGLLKPEEVRVVDREVLVVTGATMLTMREAVVEEL